MYINDLNSAYLYEHERRSDEIRAAGDHHLRTSRLKNKPKVFLTLVVPVLFIIIWIVF